MKERKSIDRIYQEKFKDFEKEPNQDLWDGIATRLDEKEKDQALVIPLWMKLTGVAAVVALIISGLLFTDLQPPVQDAPGVVYENDENPADDQINKIKKKATDVEPQGSIAFDEEIAPKEDDKTERNANSPASQPGLTQKNSIQNDPTAKISSQGSITASSNTGRNENSAEETPADLRENRITEPILKNNTEQIAEVSPVLDSTAANLLEDSTNALAEIKAEKEKNENKEVTNALADAKRLRLSTFAAPVFYKNIGSGNQLSNQFSDNSSSSEITFSYGVKVAYQISDKLMIRTGISKVNLNNKISDISFSPTASSAGFENITPGEENIQIRDNSSSESRLPTGVTGLNNAVSAGNFIPGEISQQFGYLEIPVELEFAVINKRFGLNIIGGGSNLFLDSNRVDLLSGESRTLLGEASNINKTSFSTNIGFGIDYSLTDQFRISMEPVFKYQLNTFNNVDNVQPVNFGIYSGLNFRF
ncbi:hypothetical protein [Christiangramia sabulilitoris]|uniref:PorT family protein n=1 Tax=Christiangramia sabulilitoris TaxID=2583991 RepID=A0A550I8N4_9FLAO|nr:hypothetical protein [Christiangramia sabulilitoris]TRO67330.1 hypothetical protein FGM01_05455 [Christiangramia sabulilitoris]